MSSALRQFLLASTSHQAIHTALIAHKYEYGRERSVRRRDADQVLETQDNSNEKDEPVASPEITMPRSTRKTIRSWRTP
jgi:hypothetical protein